VELQEWLGSHEIGIELGELEREVEELTKLEKNEFSSRIFKCKLKKVTS